MVGPNKDTIYPDYLPAWAQPSTSSARDTFFELVDRSRYVDLAIPLKKAKSTVSESLYYKTDTHWTPLGAGIGFQYFAKTVGDSLPKLRWLGEQMYEVESTIQRSAGDLAGFLRLENNLTDTDITIKAYNYPTTITQYDFNTGTMVYQGANTYLVTPFTPQRVISSNALNTAKVLWLRDSYGTAISPLMAATFSETLQLYQVKALQSPNVLVDLVSKFKPDYVFITVVERDSRAELFTTLPPDFR